MTNCNYIIQLPGSKSGFLTIPANFGTIENTPEIKSKLESLDREADNFLEVVSTITDDLHELTGQNVLSKEDIRDTIMNNLDNVSEIIPIINNLVENNSEFNGLAKAIKQYLVQARTKNPNAAEALKGQLETPITKEYFNRVSLNGIFNTTSVKSEHLKIQSSLGEESNSGFISNYLQPLNTFLQAIKKNNDLLYSSNTLFSTNNQFGTKSLNINELNFFREGNLDTLFVSLFKRLGSTLDVSELNNVLGTDYKKPEDFFNQKLTRTKDIKNSDFENLIADNKADKTKINNIIDLVVSKLQGNDNLKKSIKNLIINLNTTLFKDENLNRLQLEEIMAIESTEFSKEFRTLKYSSIFNKNTSNLGENYSEVKKLKSDNLYEDAIKYIIPGQDLVRFLVNNKPVNGLVTDIFIREKQGKIVGVHVRGIYKTSEGKFDEVTRDFKPYETIEYRSKESPILEYSENLLKEDRTIRLSNSLDQDVLKYLLKGGDTVNGDYVVSGIYPEHVTVNSGESTTNIPYSQINSVNSNRLYELNNLINSAQTLPIVDNISRGDIILNKSGELLVVIDPQKLNAIKIESNNAQVVKFTQEDVVEIRAGELNSFTQTDGLNILNNQNTSSKNLQFSSFTDVTKVRNNDLGTGVFEGERINFKVVDFNTSRIVTDSGKYITYDMVSDLVFYTDRDISSRTALENIKANTVQVNLKFKPGVNDVELKYIVPSNTKLNSLFLLPNNHANIGWFQEATKPLEKNEKDGTKAIIRLLKKKGESGDTIFGEKEYSNKSKLKRNLSNYRKIERFSDLSKESKEALNILKSGTYFNVYTESSIDPLTYRISENKGDVVTAQYNTLNHNGDIITIERDFDVSTLLNSKNPGDTSYPTGSIANLYLHYRNRNLKSVINAITENANPERVRTQQSINELSNNIERTFSKLNIPVIQTDKLFEKGQRAKLHSDSEGNVSIMLNTKSGDFSDLIHETLHIYLTLLRYSDTQAYVRLIESVVKNDKNIYDKEEDFVTEVVAFSKGGTNFLYSDLKTFMNEMALVINNLVKDSTGEDLELSFSDIMNNPIEFLNTSLGSFYNINQTKNTHPMWNVGLLSFEPSFRNWLRDNNITLKCD